ncbi:MAG TPA: hypothetical protein VE860_22590 [Chthoniobacterales bacterium]|nr:hypothetical protein [Chthoniobacterales bacterium]
MPDNVVMFQLLLHLTFVLSALMLAVTDRISAHGFFAVHTPGSEKSGEDGDDAVAAARLTDRGG